MNAWGAVVRAVVAGLIASPSGSQVSFEPGSVEFRDVAPDQMVGEAVVIRVEEGTEVADVALEIGTLFSTPPVDREQCAVDLNTRQECGITVNFVGSTPGLFRDLLLVRNDDFVPIGELVLTAEVVEVAPPTDPPRDTIGPEDGSTDQDTDTSDQLTIVILILIIGIGVAALVTARRAVRRRAVRRARVSVSDDPGSQDVEDWRGPAISVRTVIDLDEGTTTLVESDAKETR